MKLLRDEIEYKLYCQVEFKAKDHLCDKNDNQYWYRYSGTIWFRSWSSIGDFVRDQIKDDTKINHETT